MRALLLLALCVAVALAGPGRWMNRTLDYLPTYEDKTNFEFTYPAVPATGSPYYFELQLTFAEVYDEVVLDLTMPVDSHEVVPLQYVVKDKGIKTVVVFQDMSQSLNGWSVSNLGCGMIVGTVTSKSKIASIGSSLKIVTPAAPHQECVIISERPIHGLHRGAFVLLPALLMTLLALCCCLCCCCLRARRCRQQCKQVEEAYPADAVTAAVAAEAAAQDQTVDYAQQQVMYPFPVMAVPIDGGVQYALIPANEVPQ
jgi:hypothetical protein